MIRSPIPSSPPEKKSGLAEEEVHLEVVEEENEENKENEKEEWFSRLLICWITDRRNIRYHDIIAGE